MQSAVCVHREGLGPTPSHVLGRISPIFPPFFPVFCAFSPSRRGGSNEPKTGIQGHETVPRAPKHRFAGPANSGCSERMEACGGLSAGAEAGQPAVRPTPLKNGGDHSFGGRFGPLRNRPPVFWCHFLESWLQDGENREKTRKNGANMGEIWPKKKSAGRRPILDG